MKIVLWIVVDLFQHKLTKPSVQATHVRQVTNVLIGHTQAHAHAHTRTHTHSCIYTQGITVVWEHGKYVSDARWGVHSRNVSYNNVNYMQPIPCIQHVYTKDMTFRFNSYGKSTTVTTYDKPITYDKSIPVIC